MARGKDARAYMQKAASLGCLICRRLGFPGTPAELHHPRTGRGVGLRGDDMDIIPLCPEHHRGNTGIHGLGRREFERQYGVTEMELVEETKRLVAELEAYNE